MRVLWKIFLRSFTKSFAKVTYINKTSLTFLFTVKSAIPKITITKYSWNSDGCKAVLFCNALKQRTLAQCPWRRKINSKRNRKVLITASIYGIKLCGINKDTSIFDPLSLWIDRGKALLLLWYLIILWTFHEFFLLLETLEISKIGYFHSFFHELGLVNFKYFRWP